MISSKHTMNAPNDSSLECLVCRVAPTRINPKSPSAGTDSEALHLPAHECLCSSEGDLLVS